MLPRGSETPSTVTTVPLADDNKSLAARRALEVEQRQQFVASGASASAQSQIPPNVRSAASATPMLVVRVSNAASRSVP